MKSSNPWGLWGGIALIVFGGLFLLGTLLDVNIWGAIWPLFIVAAGLAFFAGMFAGGRSTGALAIPGSIFVTIGLILFVQSLFNLWASWTYAWTLIIAGVGIGLFLFGSRSDIPEVRTAGRVVIVVGLVLFFIFGAMFELGAALFGLRSPGGLIWPILLILAGLYVLFGRMLPGRWAGPAAQKTIPLALGPDGEVQTSITGVRRVRFRTIGDLTIQQGEGESLKVEAPQPLIDRLKVDVRGDTLDISLEQDWWEWMNPANWNVGKIRYTLLLRDLEYLNASGVGSIVVPALKTARFEVSQSGAGSIDIRGLDTEELQVSLSGVGSLDVAGRAARQKVDLSGAGSYHARKLESQVAGVKVSGVGSADVSVAEELDARISGTGSIDYHGSPRLTQHVSGVGSVHGHS
jgi:hypothetical protein